MSSSKQSEFKKFHLNILRVLTAMGFDHGSDLVNFESKGNRIRAWWWDSNTLQASDIPIEYFDESDESIRSLEKLRKKRAPKVKKCVTLQTKLAKSTSARITAQLAYDNRDAIAWQALKAAIDSQEMDLDNLNRHLEKHVWLLEDQYARL